MLHLTWLDTPRRYGAISRGFHWLMALLLAWQFAGALLYVSLGDVAITRFVGSSHFTLGFTLFVLVLLRGGWALVNLHRRPPHGNGGGRAAAIGHGALYVLMLVIPGLALLRQYGSGEAFTPFGLSIMPARAEKIGWMILPADVFHYWLGFLLLLFVTGHIAMAFLHRRAGKADVLARML